MTTQNKTLKKSSTCKDSVVGVFHSQTEAQAAVRELKAAGFNDDQIGVVTKGEEGAAYDGADADNNMAAEGAAAGAIGGLGTGAIWGIGIAAGILPAIGPVIAGGTLAAIAASAATTAAAGGLAGAMVGLGIPEDEADYYQTELERGRTIVTVKCGEAHYSKANAILDGANSYDFDRRESDYANNANAAQRMDASGKLVAKKEILDVDKTEKTAGQAAVHKEVTTEMKQVEVPVKKEELVIERTDLDNRETGAINEGDSESMRVTLKEEEVDVNKRTVAKEAVSVGKRTVTDNKTVAAEVKEEKIVVDHPDRN